jgi:hypothetical protein
MGTKQVELSKIRTIFSDAAVGTAGPRWLDASRALLNARQIAHGLSGSNVSFAAATMDFVVV